MTTTVKSSTKAIVVSPHSIGDYTVSSRIIELTRLAQSLNIEPFLFIKNKIKNINKKFYISIILIDYLKDIIKNNNVDLIVFNCDLSPTWQRNIEKEICCKVIDRTELILDIFADRARSFEGKLQVELAQLKHMSTRLVRVWTHLERQKGGIGLRGGPGEKQIETDRRIIRKKIDRIEKKLSKVVKTRSENRRLRDKNNVKTVALVGYTNAGKSTLFNRLTRKSVLALDMPFASLDTSSGKFFLSENTSCVLIDTVGFINELPDSLFNAFKSSLEEVNRADVIVHIIDITDPNFSHNRECVNLTLSEVLHSEKPIIEVYNKIDNYQYPKDTKHFYISAQFNLGIDPLKNHIENLLKQN